MVSRRHEPEAFKGEVAKGDCVIMTIEVYTKDCSALSDAELGEMADLSTAGAGWEAGLLSKEAEAWVLVSQAYDDRARLQGFVMSTLERIGGTPALVMGLACVGRVRSRSTVLKGLMHDQFHKTLMAFPDEDVVISTRLRDAGPLDGFGGLTDVRPWPDTRANGEERAWGRRLAKRFGATAFDDRSMIATGDGSNLFFDHDSVKTSDVSVIFENCHQNLDEHVIAWGWGMAEYLERFENPLNH